MNILVTGGTGFIGGALCRRLLAGGHAVSVLTRERQRAEQLLQGKVAAIESLDELPQETAPEAIVNLAGLSPGSGRWTERLKQEFLAGRVGVTRQVIRYIARTDRKPGILISGSAVGYYGARGDEELGEDAPPGNEYQSHLCKAWEAEAFKAAQYGVRVCVSRTGVVLGKGGGALSSLVSQFRLGLGGYVGSGRQWMSWVHIDDLVGIMLHLMADESLAGAFNTTAPNPEMNRDFARELAAALHRPALMWAPGWLLRLMVGEMAHLYVTGQKVLPSRLLESGYRFKFPELRAALADILA
ncbi:MAG: TIGR01777 family oxidoreductase [Acidiferrobacterales bacterium]